MRKWLKYVMYTISGLVLALLVYCGHLDYIIFPFGNQYYIQVDRSFIFMDIPYLNGSKWSDFGTGQYLIFNSLSEMKHQLLSGDLTEENLRNLRISAYAEFIPRSKRRIPTRIDANGCLRFFVFDPFNLYELIPPSSSPIYHDEVILSLPGNYTHVVKCENVGECRLRLLSQKGYKNTIDEHLNFKSWLEQKSYDIHDIITDAERNATEYIYNNGYKDKKTIIYQIEGINGTYTVVEDYFFDKNFAKSIEIKLYGSLDGQGFAIKLPSFHERPSVEWLSQFGIQKFEG